MVSFKYQFGAKIYKIIQSFTKKIKDKNKIDVRLI